MRRDEALLLDMLLSARKVRQFTRRVSWNRFQGDILRQSAVIRELSVIGEAARLVSEDTRNAYPTIDWKNMMGMRHRLVHAYFDVRLEVVWDTATHDIPVLISQLEAILPDAPVS